ncbi:MAG: hypothetical protein KDE27_20600 [Planctomycetes bacterium]|nr:hypothetical protein [Planctomycetota bacterium]
MSERSPLQTWIGLALLGLPSCVAPDDNEFRGKDRSALLLSARLRLARDPDAPPPPPERFSYRSGVEFDVNYRDGDFGDPGGRADYTVWSGHIAFAPELSWHGVTLGPLAGASFGDLTVERGTARSQESSLGGVLGVEASWRGWDYVQPYVRYSRKFAFDWSIGRFESGIELRATPNVGFQIAYARQTNRIDELELFGFGDSARIATEGVHLGLCWRF